VPHFWPVLPEVGIFVHTDFQGRDELYPDFRAKFPGRFQGDFKGKNMKYWQRFSTYKQRGEWVELKFMTEAAQRRFGVSKPWGDTRAYDVGVEHGENFLRVQVKSTATGLTRDIAASLFRSI
jgi:hypothetical protein